MENTIKKITKAQVLNFLMTQVETMNFDNTDVAAEDVENYIETTLTQLAKKNAVAAEKRAEKKAAGDELKAEVKAVLTEEFQTRDEIFAQIENADGTISIAKIGARLTQLCANGEVIKENIKTETGKKMAYKLA